MKSQDLNATSVRSKRPLIPEVCSSQRFWPHLHDFFFSISFLVVIWLMLKIGIETKKQNNNKTHAGLLHEP